MKCKQLFNIFKLEAFSMYIWRKKNNFPECRLSLNKGLYHFDVQRMMFLPIGFSVNMEIYLHMVKQFEQKKFHQVGEVRNLN